MQFPESQSTALPSSLRLLQPRDPVQAPRSLALQALPLPPFLPPGKGQFGSVRQVTHRFTGDKFAVKSIAKRRLVTQVWDTVLMEWLGRCLHTGMRALGGAGTRAQMTRAWL